MNKKYILSVLGQDRPGIVAFVARTLAAGGWNIEDITQTILQTEFAGIFLITSDGAGQVDAFQKSLNAQLESLELSARVKPMASVLPGLSKEQTEPFVVIATGEDRVGTISAIATVMEKFSANINNLRTVQRKDLGPNHAIMIYELDVPGDVELSDLRSELEQAGSKLDLQVSIQHRDIFENIHRV